MKKTIVVFSLGLLATSFAFAQEKALDIRPSATTEKALTGVEWENTNDVALASATSDAALAALVRNKYTAKALLAQVQGAYLTDPLAARKIAAVSQWVMQPDPWYCLWWDGDHATARKLWVEALLTRAEGSKDSYVKTFCLDQLRWCGCDCPEVLERIRAIGVNGDKAVADFSEVVIRELTGQAIGL